MSALRRLGQRERPHSWVLPASLCAVCLIVLLDWLTPAGIVVGVLLSLPIIATALTGDSRLVWIVAVAAMAGFLVAAQFGRGPVSPALVWAPNRVFAFLTLPGSLVIARLLQQARLRIAAEQDRAARASDLNRLLLSLLAHDMRSPLSMAIQALDYVRFTEDAGVPMDNALLYDAGQRLRRGLGAIDRTLALAGGDATSATAETEQQRSGRELLAELDAEARSFESEAAARGKTIEVDLGAAPDESFRTDPLLARQALAILVDNAVRHAQPGSIRVMASLAGGELRVIVSDAGPGRPRPPGPGPGAGIGLALCRALVARAGGDIVSMDIGPGTHLLLRLPLTPA